MNNDSTENDELVSFNIESLLKSYFKTHETACLDQLAALRIPIPHWHFFMLTDRPRLEYYKRIIEDSVKDKIVLDIGAGSGVLSHLALKYGAKKVYSVEFNPHLQIVYEHLLGTHIKSGRAKLLKMDAHDLTLETFGVDKPQVILHEIFGADALSENVLSVFTSLKKNGILENCEALPSSFEILLEPVFNQYYDDFFKLEDFEGFPLSELSTIAALSPRLLKDTEVGNDWINVGKEVILLNVNMHNPEVGSTFKTTIKLDKPCSHLRLSIKLRNKQSLVLNSSHAAGPSHWINTFYPVPQWHRIKSEFEVEFYFNGQGLDLISIN